MITKIAIPEVTSVIMENANVVWAHPANIHKYVKTDIAKIQVIVCN